MNINCSVALHDFMRLLFKLLNLIGCYVNRKDDFLKNEADSLHISHIASTGKRKTAFRSSSYSGAA